MIEFFLGLLAGILLTNIISAIKVRLEVQELDKQFKEKLEKLKEKIIPSRIEEVNGSLFLYNKETNEFLGQGKTLDDLESNVRLKYPNKLFNVSQTELDKYE